MVELPEGAVRPLIQEKNPEVKDNGLQTIKKSVIRINKLFN